MLQGVLPKSQIVWLTLNISITNVSNCGMMGLQNQQKDLFGYNIDLDQRVRSDNPLRRIAAAIDFSFARLEVQHTYGQNGNVSVDPVIILKMMFLLFFDDIASVKTIRSAGGKTAKAIRFPKPALFVFARELQRARFSR